MKISFKGINYELNENNFTAKIIKSPKAEGNILIPLSVNYNNHDYFIDTIGEDAFILNTKIKSINFPDDSKLYSIEKNAFSNSSIKEISFPSNLREFKEGWCKLVSYLMNISVSPTNCYIKYYENCFLLSKSNENDGKFDNLIFARRDIEEEVIIPDFITRIYPFSFSFCKYLKSIKFSSNSQLISIGEEAFSSSKIECITLPPLVQFLEEGWCKFTSKLTKISISPQNRYFTYIENKYILKKSDQENNDIIVFASRDIEEISVPSFVKRIASNSFSNCRQLKNVLFSLNSHLDSIGKEAFNWTSIEAISIPLSVTRIEEAAFSNCSKLSSIEFPKNCKIKKFDKFLFTNTNIQSILIPSKVTKICQGAFERCNKLKSVEFPSDSELYSIEKNAFYLSSIEEICFPSKVTEFEKGWCKSMPYLKNISVSPINSCIKYFENKFLLKKSSDKIDGKFDTLIFARRDIKETALIPDFVKEISPFSFSYCNKLKSVKFLPNSELRSIDESAFEKSSLKKIEIPSNVTFIDANAFIDCYDLEVVEFEPNSELRSIGDRAFINTKIKNFVGPQKVECLGNNLFYQSLSLTAVELLSSELKIGSGCFMASFRLMLISIPNSVKITIGDDAFMELSKNFTLYVKNYCSFD